jgi:hypothetical protein
MGDDTRTISGTPPASGKTESRGGRDPKWTPPWETTSARSEILNGDMDGNGEQTRYVKRVVLPGGKTIEVVYVKEAEVPALPPVEAPKAPDPQVAEPHQDLHVCIECASDLVYPIRWEESGPETWSVLLQCPNCDICRQGTFSQDTVELFDEELDRGADALTRDYKRLVRANMAEELERFVGALNADAILPEDF